MAEYVYDDIITAKDVLLGKVKKEDIIGTSGWFLDIIPEDMSVNVLGRIGRFGILKNICLDYAGAFRESTTGLAWIYFLPEKKESAPEFKVGDKVKIVKEWVGWEPHCNPTVGKTGIIKIINNTSCLSVYLPEDDDWWGYSPDALELIEETAEDQPDSISSSNEDIDQPEYEPFDLDNPEVRRELMGKTIINNYGLDGDGEFREVMIVGFMNKSDEDRDCWSSNGDTEGTIAMTVEGYFHADELLKECTFSDGTPCGRLKED